jgi:hypothetical protein
MDKTIKKIVELNKKFYVCKEFNNDIYVQELISIMQNYILEYNMYLQHQNSGFLSNFIRTDLNHFSFNNSDFSNSENSGTTLSELSTVETEDDEPVNSNNSNNSLVNVFNNISNNSTLNIYDNTTNIGKNANNNVDNTYDVDNVDNTHNVDNVDNTYDVDNVDNTHNVDNVDNTYDVEYIDQCCARVDYEIYDLDNYESEFIDNYPAGVYIDDNGCIIGSPCCNQVSNFNELNNIFCDEHIYSYEDIREPPSY